MIKTNWQEIEAIKEEREKRHFKKPVTVTKTKDNKLEFTITLTEEDIRIIRLVVNNARTNIKRRYEEHDNGEYNETKLAYIKRDDAWVGQFEAFINKNCEEAIIDRDLIEAGLI